MTSGVLGECPYWHLHDRGLYGRAGCPGCRRTGRGEQTALPVAQGGGPRDEPSMTG